MGGWIEGEEEEEEKEEEKEEEEEEKEEEGEEEEEEEEEQYRSRRIRKMWKGKEEEGKVCNWFLIITPYVHAQLKI